VLIDYKECVPIIILLYCKRLGH